MAKETNKHMDIHDRIKIQDGLRDKKSFSAIAREIGTCASTVSREVKANRTRRLPKSKVRDLCMKKTECRKRGVCGREGCGILCKTCKIVSCSDFCPEFDERACGDLERAPFVCDGCRRAANCGMR